MIEWNCPCGNSYKFHGFTEDMQQRSSSATPRKPLDMFEVEELAKQCGLKWSTKLQNLCDMVAMSVDTDDISSERVDETAENVHEPVAWLCKRKDGHFDVLTDQTCTKCFPVYTHPQKIGMTAKGWRKRGGGGRPK